jgi:transcriptional regulator with XRE-family HTH domain
MANRVPEARQIGAMLGNFFGEKGWTQVEVGVRYGVSQSRIGRIYAGDFTSRSGTARQMCVEAGIPFLDGVADNGSYIRNRNKLVRLIDDVWQGTNEDAVLVAEALQAMRKLRKSSDKQSTR